MLHRNRRRVRGLGPAMVRRLGRLYSGWLHQAPLLTKALTSAALFGVGDRIAQHSEAEARGAAVGASASDELAIITITEEREGGGDEFLSASARRTLRMMVWGGCFLAPTLHKWFAVVDRIIPGSGAVVLGKKIALDMFFFAPQISLAFFVTTKCMEGHLPHEAVDAGLERLPATLQANYSVWPFANMVAFGVVPIQYRILFSNCVSLWWSSFLSRISNTQINGEAAEPEAEL